MLNHIGVELAFEINYLTKILFMLSYSLVFQMENDQHFSTNLPH